MGEINRIFGHYGLAYPKKPRCMVVPMAGYARLIAGLTAAVLLAGCYVSLPSGKRADAVSECVARDFRVTPPAGRWVVEELPPGERAPYMNAWWDSLFTRISVESRPGLVFCSVPRIDIPVDDGRPRRDRLTVDGAFWGYCFSVLAYGLAEIDTATTSYGDLARELEVAVRSMTAPNASEFSWGGVFKFQEHRHRPAHGRLIRVVIGGREFWDICMVADDDENHIVRDTHESPRFLVHAETGVMIVFFFPSEMELEDEHWKVIESLRVSPADTRGSRRL